MTKKWKKEKGEIPPETEMGKQMGKRKPRDPKRGASDQGKQLELFEPGVDHADGGQGLQCPGVGQEQPSTGLVFDVATEYGLAAQKPPSGASESAPVADTGTGRERSGISDLPKSVSVPDIGEHDAIQDPSVEEFCEQVARIVARGKPGQVRRKR